MFLQNALRASLALLLVCALASFCRAIAPTARSETAQETAIGPDAADALARIGKTLSAKQFSFHPTFPGFRIVAGPGSSLRAS